MTSAVESSLKIYAKTLWAKVNLAKYLNEESLTTVLQIFCIILLHSKVIIKSIVGPDNNFFAELLFS